MSRLTSSTAGAEMPYRLPTLRTWTRTRVIALLELPRAERSWQLAARSRVRVDRLHRRPVDAVAGGLAAVRPVELERLVAQAVEAVDLALGQVERGARPRRHLAIAGEDDAGASQDDVDLGLVMVVARVV